MAAVPTTIVRRSPPPLDMAAFRQALAIAVDQAEQKDSRLAVLFITAGHPLESHEPLPPRVREDLRLFIRKTLGPLGECVALDHGEYVAFACNVGEQDDAEAFMRQLQQQAERRLYELGHGDQLKVGATLYPEGGQGIPDLLVHAYAAMLDAVVYGGSSISFFDATTYTAATHRARVTEQVTTAITDGRIKPYYQPKVDLTTGRPIGAEALARMYREDGKAVHPAEFLPYIDTSLCLLELDTFMVRAAVAQLHAWKHEGIDLMVSVNVSPRLFDRPEFTDRVDALLNQYPDVAASSLALEVLETLDIADVSLARRLFDRLRSRGVRILLDDYGTGRSSAAYLKMFEVDGIKIDRCFVRDLAHGPNRTKDRAIVQSAVTVAGAFGLQVTAEGIEHPDTVRELLALGVTIGQGYLYARPMTADDFTIWYR